jgi:hypothetical protein
VEKTQTQVARAYEVWDGDYVDIVCEECADKFAEERNLEWRSGKRVDSFTENSEELGMGASCIAGYALGDSDYPHSCCGIYLDTRFTAEGERYLREEFSAEVVKLYYPE